MALIVGDTHGRYGRTNEFLKYKPEETHVFVGDYTDSYFATNHDIIETMKVIFDSNAITLVGNHDLQYFSNATSKLKCTGFRPEAFGFIHMLEANKDRLVASYIEDDYIITHAGITRAIGKKFDNINDLSEWINFEFDQWKNAVIPHETLSEIFNIGSTRGGWATYGGPFWADYRYEKFDVRFNQVFGHSYSSNSKILYAGKKPHTIHVCVDCPQWYCYNTKTGLIEDFFPDELKDKRDMIEISF